MGVFLVLVFVIHVGLSATPCMDLFLEEEGHACQQDAYVALPKNLLLRLFPCALDCLQFMRMSGSSNVYALH